VDVQAVGLTDLGKADGFLERQVGGWFKRGQRVLSESQQEKLDAIRDWLSANLPQRRLATLVHNDFKLDNMLIDPDSLEVRGVVDWDMCTIGDPFYELAILLAYWGGRSDHELVAYQCRMPCEADGWWTRRQVVDRYLALTGQSLGEQDLAFYWWLTQYRNVVVYAQLNAQFAHTGERPSAMTDEEIDRLELAVNGLLHFAEDELGKLPNDLLAEC
jgi:aminoglycoside phosphotransferase (APT) family kinase protein